jgi:enoyl-CoA hydratase
MLAFALRRRLQSTLASTYQYIQLETIERVALIRLNRPKQLNALCDELMDELNHCTSLLDKDSKIGCIIITGSGEKAFAAGADIKQMIPRQFVDSYMNNSLGHWANVKYKHH